METHCVIYVSDIMLVDSCTLGFRFSKSFYFNQTAIENNATCVAIRRNHNWLVLISRRYNNFAQLLLVALSRYSLQLQICEIRNLQNRNSGKDNRKCFGCEDLQWHSEKEIKIYIYITFCEVARDNAFLVMVPYCPHHVVTCYINSLLTNKYIERFL